jgi:hypothetical protein
MRAFVLSLALFVPLFENICIGQDTTPEITADEIVARHEATWKKLSRVHFDMESQNQLTRMSKGERLDLNGKRVTETNLRQVQISVKGTLYLDSDRSSARFRMIDHRVVNDESISSLHEREMEETRELHDQGMIISISPKSVNIEKPPAPYPKTSSFVLGQGISMAMMAVQVPLRDWVAETRPVVTKSKNASGETCYMLAGDFKTNTTPTRAPTYRTDKVIVTLNADRGCLIERIQFALEKQEVFLSTKSSTWEVLAWHNLENGLSFPAQIEWGTECWDDPHKDWLKATFANVKLNPPDLAKQFEYSSPAGAVVYDSTGRPGTFAVSIWGADGKPSKTYANKEEFDRETRVIEMQKLVKSQQEFVAKMFPGCTVKVMRLDEKDDFHTIVYDESGAVLQEFKSNEELAVFEGMQEVIRLALGIDGGGARGR